MRKFLYVILATILFTPLRAQLCLGDSTTICPGQSVTVSALCSSGPGNPVFILDSMQQVSLSDDQYSPVVNIGFSFTYYGVAYNQLVIASNNYVTFDLSQAGGYSPWSINNPAPSPGLPLNVIMGPYQDINPGLGGTIEYGTLGTAPNRIFVVRYNQVPMFSCTQDIFCSSMVLYEGSNNIEIYIDNKPLCATWNGGVAIEGVQDLTGTLASIVAGRNFPTQWTATADAVQLVPSGPANYTINTIPYVPSLLPSGIQWWDTDGNFLGSGFDITVTPTSDTTGYYLVYDQCYTLSGGPGNTDTAWVFLHDEPLVTTTVTNIRCGVPAGSALANVTSPHGPFTYAWNDPMMQTTSLAAGLAAGTYTVVVTDTNGCTGQAVAIIDTIGYTYAFNVLDALCNGDSTGAAQVISSPIDTSLSYLWDVNAGSQNTDSATGLSAGNYNVYVTDSLGCIDTLNVSVGEPQAMTITDSITNPSCNGNNDGSVLVTVSGGTPGYTYSWGSNQLSNLSQGTYTLVVTDSNNCVLLDTFDLVEPPPLSLSLDSFPASCGLSDGSIYSTIQGGTGPYTFNWNPGGPGNDSLTNIPKGSYGVVVTDDNGCIVSDSIYVEEIPGFSVDFSLNPNSGVSPLEVSFSNNSNNCVSYYWDFGNGDTSSVFSPLPIVYVDDSTYTVMLVGCNAGGCCDTIYKTVVVLAESSCSFSNVLTPNGDGMNDFFAVDCELIEEFNMVIFNRWGNKLYETNDIEKPWDGTNGGSEVPSGTYYYIVKAVGLDGVEYLKKGTLSLIR